MEEKEHVLQILKETKKAIKEDKNIYLKELSNQTIHTASIHQDVDNIAVAVIVYAISKIIERRNYRIYPNWHDFYKKFMFCLDKAINALEKNQIEHFRAQVKCIRKNIDELTGSFKVQVQDVFRRAEVNKASRIYEHGIGMEQTAKLLGISIWELAEYSGETGISDVDLSVTLPIKERLKQAEEIFEK